jgi:hypothetical protein
MAQAQTGPPGPREWQSRSIPCTSGGSWAPMPGERPELEAGRPTAVRATAGTGLSDPWRSAIGIRLTDTARETTGKTADLSAARTEELEE